MGLQMEQNAQTLLEAILSSYGSNQNRNALILTLTSTFSEFESKLLLQP